MTRAEAHIALAQMIGDPILVVGSSIPDGARYSTALRDIYLWRGMVKVMRDEFNKVKQLPRDQQADALALAFPTSWINEEITVGNPIPQYGSFNLSKPAFFVSSVGTIALTSNELIYDYQTPQQFHYLRSRRNRITPDPMFTVLGETELAITQGTVVTETQVNYWMSADDYAAFSSALADLVVYYLPIPTKPSTQAHDDLLDFELIYVEDALAWADMMSRYDAQDLTANPLLQMGGGR